ncbi:hypothetical protein BC830DRAFT_84913 [Chytriomyces sp. MP71]|nr:hypothetical protein BC830DRAFT_84913 [Chytriomyces sp. MP71]
MATNLLVVGSTGGTGFEVLKQALALPDHKIHALVRSVDKLKGLLPNGIRSSSASISATPPTKIPCKKRLLTPARMSSVALGTRPGKKTLSASTRCGHRARML